jgi:RNA-binding protein YhbY
MVTRGQATIQIGHSGVTNGFMEILENTFKKRTNVKIHLSTSAGHEKAKVKEVAEKIKENLGEKYTYRIVGFSIFFKKWRKLRKEQ